MIPFLNSHFHTLKTLLMGSLQVLLLLFLIISVVHSKNHCPISFCGVEIQYPFKLERQQHSQNCQYTTNLTCTNDGIAILNLPFSGDFYIQSIDYDSYTIAISDPDKCLPGRLMNLTISSPFLAKEHQNYTFYNCPAKVNLTSIGCLSNSSNAIVANSLVPRRVMEGSYGCSIISTFQVPVSWFHSYELGKQNILMLTWSVPVCKQCSQEKGGLNWKLKLLAVVLMLPAIAVGLVLLFIFITCCIHAVLSIPRERFSAAAYQSQIARMTTLPANYNTTLLATGDVAGLDDSRINSCSELVILDLSKNCSTVPGLIENSSCPICLENYSDKDRVRKIKSCDHSFHVECIDQWLRKSRTCPVCRITLLDVMAS